MLNTLHLIFFSGLISETWVLKDGSFDDFNKIAKHLLSTHIA